MAFTLQGAVGLQRCRKSHRDLRHRLGPILKASNSRSVESRVRLCSFVSAGKAYDMSKIASYKCSKRLILPWLRPATDVTLLVA